MPSRRSCRVKNRCPTVRRGCRDPAIAVGSLAADGTGKRPALTIRPAKSPGPYGNLHGDRQASQAPGPYGKADRRVAST